MPNKHASPSFSRTAFTALIFAMAVFLGEITFGNPDFPITVWYFKKIPSWQWSLPVHMAGFIWLLVCNRLFSKRSVMLPIIAATLFFLGGETLNWYILEIFEYAGRTPWQRALSFWTVILMYAGLCTGVVLVLRRPETKKP